MVNFIKIIFQIWLDSQCIDWLSILENHNIKQVFGIAGSLVVLYSTRRNEYDS